MIAVDTIAWWTLKGSLIAAIAFSATLLLRRQPAAVRHAVWAVALVAHLALPLSGWIAPERTLSVEVPAVSILSMSPSEERGTPVPSTQPRNGTSNRSIELPQLSRVLFVLLVAGVALLLLRLAAGTVRVLMIARHSERVVDGEWLALVQRHCRALAISRPVTLMWSDRIHLPVTWGFVYPVILLPDAARDWPAELRKHVLLHELAHVRRGDALTQLAAQIAVSLFWFNPLVWLAARRLREEAENACDDYVLRDGERPSVYAMTLVELVRAHHGIEPPAFASLSVGRRSELEHRVSAITHPHRDPSRRRAVFSTAVAAMLVLVLPLSAVQRAVERVSDDRDPQAASDSPENAKVTFASIECSPVAGPDFDFGEISGTYTDDHGNTAHYFFLRPTPNRCIEASFTPETQFAPGDRDLMPSPGLSALIHEVVDTTDRVVRISESGGTLVRDYSINGTPTPWDAAAERWFQGVLPDVIRRTGAGVDDRAARILRSGGVDALFQEIRAIHLTSVRRDYLLALLDLQTPAQLPRGRVFELADEVLAEYEPERAAFFAEVVRREGSDEVVLADVLGEIDTLRDAADRKTVLDALAAHRDPRVRMTALEMLELLPGDVWKRTFFESAAPLYLNGDPLLRAAFLEATNAIRKPSEREALDEALRRYDPAAQVPSRAPSVDVPGR